MIRKNVVVKGRVQGVGFRYIASSIASKYQVTGWVRNEYDGSVQMEVQGPEHRVELFLQEIAKGNRFARVDSMAVTDIPIVNVMKENQFRVRY
ncbi:MAG: acylphosphatase [Clostridiales bacterium]|nr:acylphosphatase [Clostridiales bacterium]